MNSGEPLEAISKEKWIGLPAERGHERIIRINANKEYKYYLVVFKNHKGKGKKISLNFILL